MSPPSTYDVTALLRAWDAGDPQALDHLTPIVYDHLRRLARHYMARERTGHTLQTTALINEVYVKLLETTRVKWQDRAHFFALCAQMMRRILTDMARTRYAVRRGAGARTINLDECPVVGAAARPEVLALNDALDSLAKLDPRKAQVVELRYFGGLSVEESAEVLKVSPETVMRDWRLAKAWLWRELRGEREHAA